MTMGALWTAIKLAGYPSVFPVEIDEERQVVRVPGDSALTSAFNDILAEYQPLPPRVVSSLHSTWAGDVETMLTFPRP